MVDNTILDKPLKFGDKKIDRIYLSICKYTYLFAGIFSLITVLIIKPEGLREPIETSILFSFLLIAVSLLFFYVGYKIEEDREGEIEEERVNEIEN
jgi:hypothetical protein